MFELLNTWKELLTWFSLVQVSALSQHAIDVRADLVVCALLVSTGYIASCLLPSRLTC